MGISFKQVSHYYPGRKKKEFTIAIEDINWNINEKKEFIAVVGKTGSGKSTLIQHINALLLPSKGTVEILDKTITSNKKKNPRLRDIRKRVGFVFQFPEYQLFEETVLKDIMFAPKNFGFKEAEAKQKAIEIAKLLGIENLLDHSPFTLSGGQMRKVAIAGILSYDPDILVLDEPTRGLDPKAAEEIMELFYSIHKKTDKTIILISHDMNIVYQYANRVVVMNNGKIAYDGDKKTVFQTNIYKETHLEKPEVLKLIDYLNDKFKYGLNYNNYTLNDLVEEVVKRYE